MVSVADISRILKATPKDWHGTTFANKSLLGRELFAEKLLALLGSGGDLTADAVAAVGNAEDYLRVATNLSVVLEMALSAAHLDGDVSRVFTFASSTMALVAGSLAAGRSAVRAVAAAEADAARARALAPYLSALGVSLEVVDAPPTEEREKGAAGPLSVRFGGAAPSDADAGAFDAVIDPRGVLYILDKDAVSPAAVLVKRKRMATPLTTPEAEAWLSAIAEKGDCSAEVPEVTGAAEGGAEAFLAHLRGICGAPEDAPAIVCTAGLPALASLWLSLAKDEGADIVMCATAYGGSSQLVDVLVGRTDRLRKHVFPMTGAEGGAEFSARVDELLGSPALASQAGSAGPVVVFLEAPSNPDMMVPDVKALVASVKARAESLKRRIVLMIDTTLSPTSKILERIAEHDPELPALAFVSLSKSVSRGLTTGGTIVSNATAEARAMVEAAGESARAIDTVARPDQWRVLAENHTGVEDRVAKAYEVARSVASALAAAVDLPRPISFVSEVDAAAGFTPSTFSFNLPAEGADVPAAEVAQRFVDLITVDRTAFKPCVSFGQDNGLVYATVPATSTQGAIKAEDKEGQAIGGVQLVRLSFAASCSVLHVCTVIRSAIDTMYGDSAKRTRE